MSCAPGTQIAEHGTVRSAPLLVPIVVILALLRPDSAIAGRNVGARRAPARSAAPTTRAARAAIAKLIAERPPPGVHRRDLGRVRVVGTYRKGEGKGVANQTG